MSCWPPSPCDRLSRSPRRARHPPRLLRGLRPTLRRYLDSEPESSRLAALAARPKQTVPQGGSHVHQIIDWSGRRPALLRQHRHGYAADLHRGLLTAGTKRLRSRHPQGCRALQTGPYPPGWSRLRGYGASTTGSLALHLLTSLNEPAPSGSTDTARLLGAACHRSPSFPVLGCPDASSGRCDGPTETVSHHLSIHLAPRGAQLRREKSRRSLQNRIGSS
jgi:hypothetical protein